MARIRTLKPEFWTDELVGQLTRDVRLLYLALISLADDDGRFRAHAASIRSDAFRYDLDVTSEMVDRWLAELVALGRVVVYEQSRQRYGAIVRWATHQKISHKAASRLPAPPAEMIARALESAPSCAPPESSGGSPESLRRIPETLRPDPDLNLRPPIPTGSADRAPAPARETKETGPGPGPSPATPPEPLQQGRSSSPFGLRSPPCEPQDVVDVFERVCVPKGFTPAIAPGLSLGQLPDLARLIWRAIRRERGALWWEDYFERLVDAWSPVGDGGRPFTFEQALADKTINAVLRGDHRRKARAPPGEPKGPKPPELKPL